MGVTVDLIPLLPGEPPEQAIARIYDGGVAIRWNAETEEMAIGVIQDEGPPGVPAADGAFDFGNAASLVASVHTSTIVFAVVSHRPPPSCDTP